MKKKVIAVMLAVSVAMAVTACNKDVEEENNITQDTEDILTEVEDDPDDPEAVEKSNTLVMGFDVNNPPYSYQDENGDYVGFDLDLAKEVCKRLGYELEQQPVEWQEKNTELDKGTVDFVIHGFTEDQQAEEQFDISFAPSNVALQEMIQGTLDEMEEDGTLQEIAEKWNLDLTESQKEQ